MAVKCLLLPFDSFSPLPGSFSLTAQKAAGLILRKLTALVILTQLPQKLLIEKFLNRKVEKAAPQVVRVALNRLGVTPAATISPACTKTATNTVTAIATPSGKTGRWNY